MFDGRCLILLATHNGEAYLETQLDSLLKQDVNIDILISDDCSNDSTRSIIDRYKNLHSNISIVGENMSFKSAAKNFYFLIRNAPIENYDFFAFSDQDDIWLSDKLSNAISQMREQKADGFSSDCKAFWGCPSEKTALIKKSYPQTAFDHWFESPGAGCTQVFSKNSFRLLQDFIISNWVEIQKIDYHDWLVYAYYRSNQLSWYISDDPKLFYRQHQNNQIGANRGIFQMLKRVRLLRRGWYTKQVRLIHTVCTGAPCNYLSKGFMLRNILSLRRKKSHSVFLVALKITGLLR